MDPFLPNMIMSWGGGGNRFFIAYLGKITTSDKSLKWHISPYNKVSVNPH